MTLDDLNGPDFFYCERLKCQLLKSVCIKRQRQSEKYDWKTCSRSYPQCMKCEQGQKIISEIENKHIKRHVEAQKTKDIGVTMGEVKSDAKTSVKSKTKTKPATRGPETKICPLCGVEFERNGESSQKWVAKKYCSELCAKEAKLAQTKESNAKGRKKRVFEQCEYPEVRALVMAAQYNNVDYAIYKDFISYLTMAYELGKASAAA